MKICSPSAMVGAALPVALGSFGLECCFQLELMGCPAAGLATGPR